MNKKLLIIPLLSILVIGTVFAILIHYGIFSTTLDVNQPIDVTSGTDTINCEAGETCSGASFTISNDGTSERDVLVTNNATEGIDVAYIGSLILSKKEVDFNSNVWTLISGDEVTIEYMVVGEEFSAEVTEGAIEGYVLVYYADNDNRFANPGETVLVENVIENLPTVDDENADLNDYSLEYPTTPFGAKIWYVPLSALTLNSGAYDINWGMASEFYFESSLIQYNAEGQITVYPTETLDFTPEFDVSLLFDGTADITTTVAPVAA